MNAIYPEQGAPTPSCHASTLSEVDGRIIAAWFGGEHENHPEVKIYFAEFTDGIWSTPKIIARGRGPHGEPSACWNPVLFKDPEGPLTLFYKIGATIAGWQTFKKTSEDAGLTWSHAEHLGGGIEGPVRNKPIKLGDRLICPSSTEPSWRAWLTYFSIQQSDRWTLIGPLNDIAEFQAIQPTLLTHRDGRLQALCRTRQGVIAETWSEDQGDSWSAMKSTGLPNPNSGIDAVTLKDGRHLLVYNDTVKVRSQLSVAISEDGERWDKIEELESGVGEFSYPAVIQVSNCDVHITYTNQRTTISHRVLSQL